MFLRDFPTPKGVEHSVKYLFLRCVPTVGMKCRGTIDLLSKDYLRTRDSSGMAAHRKAIRADSPAPALAGVAPEKM